MRCNVNFPSNFLVEEVLKKLFFNLLITLLWNIVFLLSETLHMAISSFQYAYPSKFPYMANFRKSIKNTCLTHIANFPHTSLSGIELIEKFMRRRLSNKFANPNMQILSALQNESRAESQAKWNLLQTESDRSGPKLKKTTACWAFVMWRPGFFGSRSVWSRIRIRFQFGSRLIFHKPVFVLSFAWVSECWMFASAAVAAKNSSAISVFVQIPCWKIYRLVGSCILCSLMCASRFYFWFRVCLNELLFNLIWLIKYPLLVLHPLQVHSSGSFELRLKYFSNDHGRDNEGRCCSGESDGATGKCLGSCKTRFRVCLKHYQATIDTTSQCTYGDVITPILGENSVNLTDAQRFQNKGFTNPIQFPFSFSWPVSKALDNIDSCGKNLSYKKRITYVDNQKKSIQL